MTLTLFFVLAVLGDVLSVSWHSAREQGQLVRVGALAGVLEILTWAPLYFAIVEENVWIMGVSVGGSMVGSVLGTWGKK